MAEIDQNNYKHQNKTIWQQILEILPVIGEVLLLFLQIFYYIGKSTYYLFVPVKMKSVKEDIVLVTGAGHGIGKELALIYAAEGCKVVLWDINAENNEKTAKEIVQKGGQKPFSYVCNVANREEVLQTAEKVKKEAGNVTILINNAGIMPTHTLEDHSPEEIRRIMDINVMAHFWTIEAFLPAMKAFNHGHIVSLSSMAGLVGFPYLVPYCASKYAVRGLLESLNAELRLNPNNKIYTTCILPYMVNTGLCKKPVLKFENLMPLLEPKFVAKKIMEIQRRNKILATIPGYMMHLNNVTRLLPVEAIIKVCDFFGVPLESDL